MNGVHVHLAGIIPLANLKTDYNLETPECLLPLDAGFTAIQKAVFECAVAGCQTIWIIANEDLAPVVRKVVGEWVHDPAYYYRQHDPFPTTRQKPIPIYYVPIHPKDRDRRDSYGWSVLHGVYSAWRVATRISHWVVPDKYYISFPMAIHNIYNVRKYRRQISEISTNWFLSYEGKTVKDNLPLPFTMNGDDYIQCRRHVNQLTTKEFINPPPGELPSERLPLEERWSARSFDLTTIFEKVNETGAHKQQTEWFYDLSTWEGYREFLGSENYVKKPAKALTKSRLDAKLPYREGEIDDD
jgi:hypothetical protein